MPQHWLTASGHCLCSPGCSYTAMRICFSQGGGKQKARNLGCLSDLATPLMGNKVIYLLSPRGGRTAHLFQSQPCRFNSTGMLPLGLCSRGSHCPHSQTCLIAALGPSYHPPQMQGQHRQQPLLGTFAWHLPHCPAVPWWH